MPAPRHVLLPLLLGAGTACQSQGKPAPTPQPTTVQVRDAAGTLLAELKPLRPCRGTIGPFELIVGGPPLISEVGTTKWAGSAAENGTILSRDGQAVARVFPTGDATKAAVLDTHGVALARVAVTDNAAVVSNAASVPVRNLKLVGDSITADEPVLTITGTKDLVLAALLSAPELTPEVRVLAACERVLVKDS